MKQEHSWAPSKFVLDGQLLRASEDTEAVAASSRLNVDLLAAALQKLIVTHGRGRFLDLGCGNVPLYGLYRPIARDITCVDWENTSHSMRHIDVAADLNRPLPLPPATFDTVVLTDVLEHIREPRQLLAEIRRVLAPGGRLLGSVPFMYRLHEEPHDHFRFTTHALAAMAGEAGFAVESLEPYGQGTDVLFDVLGKVLAGAHWRWGDAWARWAQRLGLHVRRTRWGRQLNLKQAALPLGYVFAFKASAADLELQA